MLDKFIQNLKKQMPSSLDELSIARYIYIELGKIMHFDLEYAFGNRANREKIYNNIFYRKDFINDCFNSRKIVCKSLCYIYEYILKELEINVLTVQPIEDLHTFNIILLKNGKKYMVDLQIDLEFIQTKSKTLHFASEKTEYDFITEDELFEIDKKIGYISKKENYSDFRMTLLNQLTRDSNIEFEEKFNMIITNLNLISNISDLKYYEYRKYHEYFMRQLLTQKEINKLKFCDCYIIDKELNKKFILIVSASLKNYRNRICMFNEELLKYQDISTQELKEKIQKGLTIRFGEIYIVNRYINNKNFINYM